VVVSDWWCENVVGGEEGGLTDHLGDGVVDVGSVEQVLGDVVGGHFCME
jgi:hypothetical protein